MGLGGPNIPIFYTLALKRSKAGLFSEIAVIKTATDFSGLNLA
jgi:hypothetical protein